MLSTIPSLSKTVVQGMQNTKLDFFSHEVDSFPSVLLFFKGVSVKLNTEIERHPVGIYIFIEHLDA